MSVLGWTLVLSLALQSNREFLNDTEIEKLRTLQEIDKRVEAYLEMAELRLQSARARLQGSESAPGDPMEFFSLVDLVRGYQRILDATMHNLDDTVRYKKQRGKKVTKAFQKLKEQADQFLPQLKSFIEAAQKKKDYELYRTAQKALESTETAIAGSEKALEALK